MERQNWNRAEEKLKQALRLEPANFSNSLLLSNLGLVQVNKGEYLEAINTCTLGLNIAPSSTVLLNNRAHAFLLADSINNAIKDLDKSLSIDSIQEWSLKTRAFLYIQEEKLDEAESIFNKMLNLFPENASVFVGLATIAKKQDRIKDALENYEQALKIDPEDYDAREAFVLLLIQNEDYSRAKTLLQEGIALNPENPMFYLLRGYMHRLNYRFDEAQADKKLALSKGLQPDLVNNFIP